MQANTLSNPSGDVWCGLLRRMTATESHTARSTWGYKNYLISAPESQDYSSLVAMEKQGLVRLSVKLRDGHDVFIATRKGCQFIELPKSVTEKIISNVWVSNEI